MIMGMSVGMSIRFRFVCFIWLLWIPSVYQNAFDSMPKLHMLSLL